MINILVTIGILSLALTIHETAHAYYMWKMDIPIKRAGLGFPIGPKLTFNLPKIPFPITLSLVLIGAYVEPTEEGTEQILALSHKERSLILGGGVLWNLITAAIAALLWLGGSMLEVGRGPSQIGWSIIGVSVVFIVVLPIFRKFITAYVVPVLGVLLLVYVVVTLVPTLFSVVADPASGGAEGVVGPIGIIKIGSLFTSFLDRIYFFAFLSLNFGLFNMLPLMPLDGGRIVNTPIERRFGEKFANIHTGVTVFAMMLLFVIVMYGDISGLFIGS